MCTGQPPNLLPADRSAALMTEPSLSRRRGSTLLGIVILALPIFAAAAHASEARVTLSIKNNDTQSLRCAGSVAEAIQAWWLSYAIPSNASRLSIRNACGSIARRRRASAGERRTKCVAPKNKLHASGAATLNVSFVGFRMPAGASARESAS